eukprot:605116-Pelagomonas_calceolata.AAC.1
MQMWLRIGGALSRGGGTELKKGNHNASPPDCSPFIKFMKGFWFSFQSVMDDAWETSASLPISDVAGNEWVQFHRKEKKKKRKTT